MSPLEILLRARIRNRQIYGQTFCRQASIAAYIVDFYCPALKLAIEIDGGDARSDSASSERHLQRDFVESKSSEGPVALKLRAPRHPGVPLQSQTADAVSTIERGRALITHSADRKRLSDARHRLVAQLTQVVHFGAAPQWSAAQRRGKLVGQNAAMNISGRIF